MKKLLVMALSAAVGALLLGYAPNATAQNSGFYVKADLGGNISQDLDVKDFFGVNVSGVKLELDPGLRGGVGGGYQVTEWFAAEAELGFMINEINAVKGNGTVHDSTFSNVPFLVNAKFQLPTSRCPFKPYAGAGIGFSESIFDVDYMRIGNVSISGSDATTVFAWQAFAGLRYAINDQMGLSVEYRYFEADSPSWEADFSYYGPDTFRLGRSRTHAISLAFDFRF